MKTWPKVRQFFPGDRIGIFPLVEELASVQKNNSYERRWIFKCHCWLEFKCRFESARLRQSCGCLTSELKSKHNLRHWLAKRWKEHRYWRTIKWAYDRCYNIQRRDYPNYWWRWIKFYSEREKDLSKFAEYLDNELPDRKDWETLDRIDVNWNYEPDNLRWASQSEQCCNKRNNLLMEWNWKIQTMSERAKETGINHTTLSNRYHHIWLRGDDLFKQKPYFKGRVK